MLAEVEFYTTPEGDIMVKPMGMPVRQLTEADRELIPELLSMIRDLYPEAFARLSEVYSRNERNRIHYEFMMVSRFIRCNFGEYDQNRLDIDASGVLRFEEVHCPLRGECRDECVVCKPRLQTGLTPRESEILHSSARACKCRKWLMNFASPLQPSTVTARTLRPNSA